MLSPHLLSFIFTIMQRTKMPWKRKSRLKPMGNQRRERKREDSKRTEATNKV